MYSAIKMLSRFYGGGRFGRLADAFLAPVCRVKRNWIELFTSDKAAITSKYFDKNKIGKKDVFINKIMLYFAMMGRWQSLRLLARMIFPRKAWLTLLYGKGFLKSSLRALHPLSITILYIYLRAVYYIKGLVI